MKQLFFLFVVVSFTACNSNNSGVASSDSATNSGTLMSPVTTAEHYSGTIPCADCEGIDVSIQLNSDSTFIINTVYKGSRADSLDNKYKLIGLWRLYGDTLHLTDANGVLTKYIKMDTALIQLDNNGKLITGPLASMYVLHKK
ncbi:MAG: copper resistance protein NlpE N-terminal domain-containing protein [Bacteroidetes bacterium]|nr:copper resistance protein NlpE N-terminal domain-containing protein [Bacteroidota bacterium]